MSEQRMTGADFILSRILQAYREVATLLDENVDLRKRLAEAGERVAELEEAARKPSVVLRARGVATQANQPPAPLDALNNYINEQAREIKSVERGG